MMHATRTQRTTLLGGLAAACMFLLPLLGVPTEASAQDDGHVIQVFALSGPVCPVAIEGEECPDALLPGVELVLERWHRKSGVFEKVLRFKTNRAGYAVLEVERRGLYRIDIPRDAPAGLLQIPGPPFFAGPVTFRVPARHEAADGTVTTPVVVNFDSGIR